MPIALTCPKCSGKLRVADNFTAKNIKCPKCSAVFPFTPPEKPAAITTKAAPAGSARGNPSAGDSVEELEEVEELDEVGEELEEVPRARRRRNIRRDPGEEAISTLIPYKNGRALAAYYFGVFSFIPCLGLVLGPAALVLGFLGLRYAGANPTAKGTGHAIAGLIMGCLTTLGNWGALILFIVMGGIAAFK